MPGGPPRQWPLGGIHAWVDDDGSASWIQAILPGLDRAGHAYHEVAGAVRGRLMEPEPARDHVLDPRRPPWPSCLLVCQRPVDLRPWRPEHRDLRLVLGHHCSHRGDQLSGVAPCMVIIPGKDQRGAPVLRRAPRELPVFLECRHDRDPVPAEAREQRVEPNVAAASKARGGHDDHRRECTACHALTGSNMSSQSSGPGRLIARRKCSCSRRASADLYICG